ncbi:signal peptidase I [Glaciihabitans sp. INWT7]|uniref:signal peptidase I n=1 Tax=Glaciihabitans sp. INWT7 TaxID=2596912 RepID=UPI001624E7E7|nr:signal peptidase I [Glaciihabitans sp. INWT7]QNE46561.1 signal peptidase I [Glaciihabitans sp. INWT7]
MKRLRLALACVIPLLVAVAFVLAATGALPYKLYVVHTGSMSPTIPSRSAVIVREHQYRVGQPIAFLADGTVITHRLMSINADGTITTKGDANETPDPWQVRTGAIIGGVVASPPELGYWLTYLKNPLGLASILASAVLLWQIWSLTGAAAQDSPSASSSAGRSPARTRHRHRRVHRLPYTDRSTATTLPSSSA